MKRLAWYPLLAIFLALPSFGAERRIGVEPSSTQVKRYHKIEFSLAVDAKGENPYDPTEIDLRMEFIAPSGKSVSVPAFYYQAYERRPLSRGGNSGEWMYPTGRATWKVRFAPTEVGSYACTAILNDRAGSARSERLSFECIPSSDKGFIRVSARDPRYLEFDDGSPFFAVGQNVAFVHNAYATVEKIRKLGENGANFARVWACAEDWAMAIEARKSAWGRSWNWNPPIVLMPDRDGFHGQELCLKLSGEAGASLNHSPSHPIGVRPHTRYRLAGQIRTTDGMDLTLDLGGQHTLAGKRQWTQFQQEFTTGPDQWWLPDFTFRLSSKGTAWLRDLSLTEAGGGPEMLGEADVNRPLLGVYNQADCDMLDQVVEAAEQSGLHLQLTLLTRDHYMSKLSNQSSQPYDQAIAFGKRLVRYCVARWGYSTHIATWEYFNEMNPGLPTDRFYTELGQAFEELDINRHLRGTSTWSAPAKDYRHPKLDTADLHYYIRPATKELWKDEIASVRSRWALMQQNASRRPIFFAEFGITDNNWQRAPELDKDKDFVHLHNALWASALSGFASTVCHWYWDDIHKRDLYSLYRPISRFVAAVPWTTGRLRPASATCDQELHIIGQQGDQGAYLWIADPKATWWNIAMEGIRLQPIQGASISLAGLSNGTYQIHWWNTRSGEIFKREEARVAEGKLTATVPTFTHDIACQITPSQR